MRKIALLLMITFVLGCSSQKNNNESDILNLIGEEYLKKEVPKKISEYGIAFKSFNDQEYLKNFFISLEENEALKKKKSNINKEVIDRIFDKTEIDNYISQIDEIDFNEVIFQNTKLRDFLSVKKEQKQYEYYHLSVSKPVFTKDKNFALVISMTSHLVFLNIFEKKDGEWKNRDFYSIFP